MLNAALLTIKKSQHQAKHPTMGAQVKTAWCTYAMELFSSHKGEQS